jgi:hypothetical protein
MNQTATPIDSRVEFFLAVMAGSHGNLEATPENGSSVLAVFGQAPDRTFRVALDEYGDVRLSEVAS